ncbi:serine/threonine protein kinase [Aporhodopirellula aestuarii]|uniref:Protein kinase n=1 Tax=Aporhodopirellula aestuarii TaxID=2950107 RepID=A0ABT0UBL4_9BACT|nr:serine/threonine-protein kinase [Aporhodopirellula aestuarii]MCM2373763.1 protein kinase [Aporhodopirellula aestuarii]
MPHLSERSIFFEAIDLNDPHERRAYLDQACGGDAELRASVDALLQAHEAPDHALDRPPVEVPKIDFPHHIGSKIGPYRLMEQIGEGGFGLVFVAQQEHPVRRKVALKIVKPGTGTKEVLARFEAERQAVAMMDHPNIAKVFDAGVTDDGRPYFVMELVRGVPISEFADAHQMPIRDRLELFKNVCTAVHHAHQKGVIHRDIKPSNVMVTLHDDRPVVKVIDFGVAKAIGQSLTDKTIYTRFFSMIGTPLYMSPEQAEMSGLDVDTRSDIYSLGVLLYQLLVGETPFDRERLDSAGLDEMRRIIREEDPPRPSQRLTTLNARMTTVSNARRLDVKRLTSTLRGDLDWIVMKALEKDRNRRYDSAAAMANDISRHLTEQPIQARPPTLSYQLLKFARRQRVAIATFSLVALAMMIGTGASIWQMRVAYHERDLKEVALREATQAKRDVERFAAVVTEANSLVASAQTHAGSGRWKAAMDDYDRAIELQRNYDLPWIGRAQFFTRLNMWEEAANDYAHALSLGAATDTPQWWGVVALFTLTDHMQAANELCLQLNRQIALHKPIEQWEFVRTCAACRDCMSDQSLRDLAAWTRTELAKPEPPPQWDDGPRPPDRRRHPGFLFEPEGRPLRPPPERMPSDFSRSDFTGPNDGDTDWVGPEPSGSNPRDPGAFDSDQPPPPRSNRTGPPRSPHELPRNVRQYIAGLVHLRIGEHERAIELLEQARDDRSWPASWIVDAPMAIALHATNRADDAADALARSRQSIGEVTAMLSDERNPATKPPWFDFVEFFAFYTEASELIEGTTPIDVPSLEEIRSPVLMQLR